MENWVLDSAKALYGPQTQAYGETNYLDEKTEFWTEPRHYMVLGLKPMEKPTTWMRKLSFGQNQGIVWSTDSNLWGNQLLGWENWVLDRTTVVYGPRTQTYGETKYLDGKLSFGQNQGIVWSSDSSLWGNQLLRWKTEFWIEPRHCMVLGLKPVGKPTT